MRDPEQATSAASASSSGPRTVSSTVRAGLLTRLLTDERTAERLLADDAPDAA